MASNSQSEHERPGMPNPAYPPRQPPPFSPPAYAIHQPPAAQPPFDPFRKKDPFMPSSFADRRDGASLNAPQRSDRPLRDTLQVAPAPPPSPFHSSPLTAFKDAHARRTPVDASYSRAALDPPPPPNFYSNNNSMPPPSASPKQSPPYHNTRPQSASQSSPPINGGRDGGRSKSRSRAGDSMSISSIMGPEASSAPKGNKMSPPTPHAQPVPVAHPADARPRTPDRGVGGHGSRFAEQPPFPPRPRSHLNTPEDVRQPYPYPHAPSQGSPNTSTMPPRPYSQPAQPQAVNSSAQRENGAKDEQRAARDRAISDSDKHNNAPVYVPYQPMADQPMYGPIGGIQAVDTVPGKRESAYPRWAAQEGPPANPSVRDQTQPHYTGEPSPPTKNVADSNDASVRLGRHLNGDGPRTPAVNSELRKSIEETSAHHRSILAIANESARRAERSSPFPQAVKGAQAQPAGLGRDPSIKNEFGRMFAGLGSGIGSTPQPVATSYAPPGMNADGMDDVDPERPGRPAQTTEGHRGFANTGETRNLGINGRKRRALEDEEKASSESAEGEGRATPVSGPGRLGKRSKANPTHHHHHHHHHHHRRADDPDAPRTSSPFSTFKFPNNQASASASASTPSTATGSAPPHHHHHHHHHHVPPHHHHHLPPTRAMAPAPFPRPITTIHTQPLLQSVEHLPRRHLGSVLYHCKFTLPPPSATSFSEKRNENVFFTTDPVALPPALVHAGVENCTLTMRVPRWYLRHEWRQVICRDRRVWGTDVYTDDSDVLAAAVHSGWIAGAFPDGVDVSLIDGVGDSTHTSASAAPGDTAADADGKRKTPAAATTTAIISTNGVAKKAGRTTAASAPPASTSASKPNPASSDPSKPLTSPPEPAPGPPPQDRDLHLTLLILPPLEKYTGSVWHGVRSRSWGGNHDGMSFKVERVEWVDDGEIGRWAPGTVDKAHERRKKLKKYRDERKLEDRDSEFRAQARTAKAARPASGSGSGALLKRKQSKGVNGEASGADEGAGKKRQALANGAGGASKARKIAPHQAESRLGLLAELAALVPREALPIGMESVVASASV